MKHLWNRRKRVTTSSQDAGGFFDGRSFHSGGARRHKKNTPGGVGNTHGQTGGVSGGKYLFPGVVRGIPNHDGGTSFQTGNIPGVMDRAPGAFRSTPAVFRNIPDGKRNAPGVKRGVPGDARCVPGVSGDVSGVDRYMEFKGLCHFTPFPAFPVGKNKQNAENIKNDEKINTQLN